MRTNITGTYWNRNGNPQEQTLSALAGTTTTCDDVIGHTGHLFGTQQYLDNALLIVRWIQRVGVLNGEKWVTVGSTPTLDKKFSKCPVGLHPNPPSASVAFPIPTALAKSNYAYQIIGSTNPSVADISVPTFIGELKDVPGLIRSWGNLANLQRGKAINKGAEAHLMWRWGVAPLISDIRKMLTVTQLVEKRFALLTRLQNGGVIRKRCSLSSSVIKEPDSNVVLQSEGAFITATASTVHTVKVWGSAQWKMSSKALPLPRDSASKRKLAWRLVTGMTTWEAAATSWELLPWSWLVDWFVNFSTLISGANHAIEVTWANMCLMRTVSSKRTYTPKAPAPADAWASVSGACSQEEIRKERYVVSPSAPLPLTLAPLIEGKTWSILGSLAVLKGKPKFLTKGLL